MRPDFILFPDASLRRTGNGTYAGYACVILNPQTMEYTVIAEELSKKATSVFGEAWAALRGLQFIRHIQKRNSKGKLRLLIVSDSKLLVSTFTEWIQKSWNTSDWKSWKKKDGSIVKNQEVYRRMLEVMNSGNLMVKFVHINSHSDKKKGMRGYISKKMKQARVRLNDKQLDLFIQLNAVADEAACSITQNMMRTENQFEHLRWIVPVE